MDKFKTKKFIGIGFIATHEALQHSKKFWTRRLRFRRYSAHKRALQCQMQCHSAIRLALQHYDGRGSTIFDLAP